MFTIQKGINLSHWLSQVFGWSPRHKFLTEQDIAFIAKSGFDHVRLPIDEEQMWYESGEKNIEAFTDLHAAINWCKKYDLKVVVDLHILRSHHFNAANNEGAMTLWDNVAEQDKFQDIWKQLSAELIQYSTDFLAYEYMNEPVAPKHEMWNKLVARGYNTIRELEAERTIVFGPNMWQYPSFFKYLEVPTNDKNILISFHTYDPLPFTHYKAYWIGIGEYDGPVVYPGKTIPDDQYDYFVSKSNDPKLLEIVKQTPVCDKATFKKIISPALQFAQERGLNLYCNEFGCLPSVPREGRLEYFKDIISTFNENNIAFASWDYKGDFGIVDWNRETFENGEADNDIIQILTQ